MASGNLVEAISEQVDLLKAEVKTEREASKEVDASKSRQAEMVEKIREKLEGITEENYQGKAGQKLQEEVIALRKVLDGLNPETNPSQAIWDQITITKTGDRFDIAFKPTKGMNLQTMLDSLGDKADLAYIKRNYSVNLEAELEEKTVAIFDKPGTESQNHAYIKEQGLELEGGEDVNLAIGALLFKKDLDQDAPKLNAAEKELLDIYKEKFVRCGPRSAGVRIAAYGVLRANADYYPDNCDGVPFGVVPSESK